MKLATADPAVGESLGPIADEGQLRIVPHRLAGDAVLPLAAIVELARGPAATPILTRLRGSAPGGVAIRNTFRGRTPARLGRSAPHLAACVALAAKTPVDRLERPWHLDSVAATAAWLMSDAALS